MSLRGLLASDDTMTGQQKVQCGEVMSEKKKIYIVSPHYILGEIPIDIVHHFTVQRGRRDQGGASYLLGDLTSSTRLSKACLVGVAVEADDVWLGS